MKTLGLVVDTVNRKAAPNEAKPLVKNTDGEVRHGDFNYSSWHDALSFWSLKTRHCVCY